MNFSFHVIAIFLSVFSLFSQVYAYEVTVTKSEDAIPFCDRENPFLVNQAEGICLYPPDRSINILVELDENENTRLLDNTHIMLQDIDGEFYQYDKQRYSFFHSVPADEHQSVLNAMYESGNYNIWQKIPTGILGNALLLTSSDPRVPWEPLNKGSRQVVLNEFMDIKGVKVYMGLRPNYDAGFREGSIKLVFEVQ